MCLVDLLMNLLSVTKVSISRVDTRCRFLVPSLCYLLTCDLLCLVHQKQICCLTHICIFECLLWHQKSHCMMSVSWKDYWDQMIFTFPSLVCYQHVVRIIFWKNLRQSITLPKTTMVSLWNISAELPRLSSNWPVCLWSSSLKAKYNLVNCHILLRTAQGC